MTEQIIPLEFPVEADGATISELTMRRVRVSDELAVEQIATAGAREAQLFANLCSVSKETIARLYLSDYQALQEAYRGFMRRRPPKAGS